MKKFLAGLFMMFVEVASATTINLSWIVDNNTYAQTTCESGGNLNIPSTTPTKRGYHFIGWDLADYTQLEYIESTGTQYIDTGIVLKSKATVTTVGQFLSISSPAVMSIWGFIGNSNLPRWGCSVYNDGHWLMDLNGTTSTKYANTNKHTFVNETDGTTTYDGLVDGVSIYGAPKALSQPSVYTSNTLSSYLFARNNSGTVGNFSSSRIYSFNIVQDDIEVINLIPARRNNDNVLGMYDTVTGTFFTNQGTGDFIAGPVSANQTLE